MGAAELRGRLLERWRSSPRLRDGVAAAGTFFAGLLLILADLTDVWQLGVEHLRDASRWWHIAPLAAGCLAMLGKRRRPVLALGVGAAAFAVDLALGGSIALVLVLFDLLFSVGLHASARARTAVTTVVFVIIGTASVVSGLAYGEFRVTVFVGLQLTTLLFVPLWWAANLRQQRELGAITAQRRVREAVLAERAAMARDLHDVIAAHLSTTAIHSGAALARPPDSERDRTALHRVRASSLAALEEMRSMIMLMRADDSATQEATLPGGLGQLPELVEAATADGLRVDLHVPALTEIPAVVDQAAYRIVQEALTNARKHAPGSRVRVDVAEAGSHHLTVTITNSLAPGGTLDHPSLSARTGLVMMRERATLLGGELTAGRHHGHWRVHATLPRHSATAPPPEPPPPEPLPPGPEPGESLPGRPLAEERAYEERLSGGRA